MQAAPSLRSPRLAGGAHARGAASPAVAPPVAVPRATNAAAAAAAPQSAAMAMSLSSVSSTSSPRARVLRSRRSSVAAAASSVKTGEPAAAVSQADGKEYDVVVVGAGISGLVTAQALLTDHASEVSSVLVTEARERVGGNITTRSDPAEGYLWEEGPNSFQPNDSMLKAAVDAGVADQLVFGDPKAPRFVWWEGKLRPTPSGPDVVTFDLMSFPGKIRAGLGAAGLWKAPMPAEEESVEKFVRRNLGAEVFERLIEPFCSGVYAGDPSKLSMKAAFGKVYDLELKGGSIIGGVLALLKEKKNNPPPPRDARLPPKPAGQTVGSFKRGLATLPSAIADKLGADRVALNWQLKSIEKEGGDSGKFVLKYETPQGAKTVRAKSVALTVPAYVAADLVEGKAPAAAKALREFDYPPVAAVTVAYPLSAIRKDRLREAETTSTSGATKFVLPGFGQLHPRSQGIVTLGTIYSSSLFPNRAPEQMVELLCYIGGALNRNIVNQSEDEIVAQVDKDLRAMLLDPQLAPAPKKIGVRVWPRAIPQFNVGHLDVLAAAERELGKAGWERVLLGGNYVSGVALGKCVEYGYEFAAKAAKEASKVKA